MSVSASVSQSLLQRKRHESSLIATSRKRKLREFFAIANSDEVVPQLAFLSVDVPTPSPAEARFLDDNDILQGRTLTEASIPTRRQLRSQTTTGLSNGDTNSTVRSTELPRLSSKGNREGGLGKRSRGSTPSKTHLEPTGSTQRGRDARGISPNKRRTSSRSSQAELTAGSARILDVIVDDTIENASREPRSPKDAILPAGALEQERIENVVESRPGSPGVDPRKAIPMSAEDYGRSSEPLINGANDEHHRAATAHLPPMEVQEKRLRELDRHAGDSAKSETRHDDSSLSIKVPSSNAGRGHPEPMSSPGSTVGANSATTPALHDASTDTSPENEGPGYDKSDIGDYPQTPPEVAPSRKEVLEKEQHDRIQQAQVELARAEILGSSPTAADAQLRLEDEQAAAASSSQPDQEMSGVESEPIGSDSQTLTETAGELVQEIIDDEDDEVVGVPTPGGDRGSGLDDPSKQALLSAGDSSSQAEFPSKHEGLEIITKVQTPVRVARDSEYSTTVVDSPEKSSATRKATPTTAASTPRRASMPAPTPPTLERMTTRVSSGAMRHKSVSEILGETQRPSIVSSLEKGGYAKPLFTTASGQRSASPSGSATPQSPGSGIRTLIDRAKEKERSKLSTVVFAKQPTKKEGISSLIPADGKQQNPESSDYFMPLIIAQASSASRIQPLESLLQTAHKTITTANAYVPFIEHQSHKILRRVHGLQGNDKWPFRQPMRAPEPNRPTTHWDELLKEAKWMRTDFREERKWKMAVARNLARACAEWFEADAEDRKLLQVNVGPALRVDKSGDVEMKAVLSEAEISHPTPELIQSADDDSPADEFDEEPSVSILDAVAPTAIFSLGPDDVVFGLRRSPTTDRLLEELPIYGASLKVPQSDLPTSDIDPDASWRRPAIPLSKFMGSKIVLVDERPPKKKSRYHYELDGDDDDDEVFGGTSLQRVPLPPIEVNVALFNPENKHIRDRIHAGHQFRPPSEYPMPLQSFFECRTASQWTWAEDDELKGLVREYQYNWSLISNMLVARSLFSSGAERRTPWECFERWIHLEGLPADMGKTHYFRAYNNRLEAAQRNVTQAAQVQQQPSAPGIPPLRRRGTTTSIRVERRRNQKHLTLVDAMRKLAKKRETSLQKQQHAAGLAAMRKANDIALPPQTVRHTPQDFSRLKHERELQIQERLARMQAAQEAQRRNLQQQARNAQQNPQQYGAPNGTPQPPRNPANANVAPVVNQPGTANRPNQLAVPGPNLPMQPMPNRMLGQPPMPNGHGGNPQMPLKGIPQAQMQGMQGMQGMPVPNRLPVPNPAPDPSIVMQAQHISQQQRHAIQMQQSRQQQGQNPQMHNSPPNMRANMNAMNQQVFMQNNTVMQNGQAMMAGFNPSHPNGVSTPPTNGINPVAGSSSSPRMNHPGHLAPHSGGNVSQVPKIEAHIRALNPNATPEQIMKMVGETLNQNLVNQNLAQHRQQLSQSAMQAAAGAAGGLPPLPNGIQNSPQQYAQMLRAQQERQATSVSQQVRSGSAGSGMGK